MSDPAYLCPKCKTAIPFGTRKRPAPSRCPVCHRRLFISWVADCTELLDTQQWLFMFALEREAAPFRRAHSDALIVITGVGVDRAASVAQDAIRLERPRAVISCGFAGALCEGLAIGEIVRAAEVVDTSGYHWNCDALPGNCRLLTSARMIGDPYEKRALGEKFRADAVDMESAAAAQVCRDAGVPFGCVRVISDAVDQQLSPKLVRLLNKGNVSVGKAIAALARSPNLLPEFWRLARQTSMAAKKLAVALEELRRG